MRKSSQFAGEDSSGGTKMACSCGGNVGRENN